MSVIIGIILVNIIQPGKGVPRVQDVHPEAAYRIQPTPLRGGSVLHLVDDDDRFYGTEYNSRFVIELLDQNVCGIIDETSYIGEKDIPVSYWIDDRGKKVEPETEGFGVQIKLAEREFSFLSVLIGLIPKNIFTAMANNNILPLILFSLVFGGILTTLGDKGKTVIDLF
ncbi:MAG: hypothetical protein DRP26_07250, partial [Candidatus Zixiibacteriota bacterium]